MDLLDRGALPRAFEYASLYRHVRRRVDAQHIEGHLKAEIAAAPERYVVQDPEAALALLDQKETLHSWWSALPGYIDDLQRLLNQVQGTVEEIAIQREKLRQILAR